MRGAVFLGNRKVELRTFADPTPGPGDVVIEMKASGMCGSDLKFYRSAPGAAQKALGLGNLAEPFIGGHEPCGVGGARKRRSASPPWRSRSSAATSRAVWWWRAAPAYRRRKRRAACASWITIT